MGLCLAGYWSVTVFGRKHCYRLYTEHLNEAVRWVCAVQKVIDSKAPVQTPTQLLMRDVEVSPGTGLPMPTAVGSTGVGVWGLTCPRVVVGVCARLPLCSCCFVLQEHRDSPEVLEQIYRCNPILRYTSGPLYAPLLPFPYGSLDQSGEWQIGGQRAGSCTPGWQQ